MRIGQREDSSRQSLYNRGFHTGVSTLKAVILAGGYGTRISEETIARPKPMIEIGGKPVLWHIMKLYSHHGIQDFIICCGYKGYVIKEYFANYFLHTSDVTFDMKENRMEVHSRRAEPWTVTLVDTGESTMTGGRLKRIAGYVKDETSFCHSFLPDFASTQTRWRTRFLISPGDSWESP